MGSLETNVSTANATASRSAGSNCRWRRRGKGEGGSRLALSTCVAEAARRGARELDRLQVAVRRIAALPGSARSRAARGRRMMGGKVLICIRAFGINCSERFSAWGMSPNHAFPRILGNRSGGRGRAPEAKFGQARRVTVGPDAAGIGEARSDGGNAATRGLR